MKFIAQNVAATNAKLVTARMVPTTKLKMCLYIGYLIIEPELYLRKKIVVDISIRYLVL